MLETLPDLGIDDEEYNELNDLVIKKKFKETKDRKKSGCCPNSFLCRLFRTYDTHFLLSLGL